MREVGDFEYFAAHLAGDFTHFLMRTLQELLQDAQFMHQFEGGRMNGIAAKVAQKIGVLLEYNDFNACACQQKTEHHSSWTSAHDAAFGLKSGGHGFNR